MAIDFPLSPDPCFFCGLIEAGETGDFIEERELTIARVNGVQFQEGQVVILPRRHAPTLFDLTEDELREIFATARLVGRAVSLAFESEGLLLYQNNGLASGQTVPHFISTSCRSTPMAARGARVRPPSCPRRGGPPLPPPRTA